MPRRLSRWCVALALGLTMPGAPAGRAVAAGPAHATRASLTWRSCGRLQCATLDVPLDPFHPRASVVTLALDREPARDPAHRVGSLVVNYGGPGDPGTETLQEAVATLPAVVRDRFDIVSFDPRGTGRSRPVDCVDDPTFERLWSEDGTPASEADLPRYYDGSISSVDFIAACVRRQGAWLARVGTRAVARDLDRIRAALGERRLTFLGYSYGTVLGAVYAQLFPTHVRAMVLDGAVNLSASDADEQLGNVAGFEHALDAFLADCAANRRCAFYSGGDPRGALDRLRDRFEGGLVLRSLDGRRAGVSEFYTTILAALYQRELWPTLAVTLESAARGDGTYLRRIADVYSGRRDDGTYNNFQEAIGIILCDDRPDPRVSFDDYRATYERLSARFPFFGPVFAAQPLGCDPRLPRPAPGTTLGDVRADHAPPTVVIGTTSDPATPYAGAEDLVRRLRGARLLTLDSTEHGGYARGHPCIDDWVDRYLTTRRLPPTGTRCT